MKDIRFKDSVLVKNNGRDGVMVFCMKSSTMLQFSGDVSTMILALSDQRFNREKFTVEKICQAMKKLSPSLAKKEHLHESVTEVVTYLRNKKLI